ncbi:MULTISPECIES: NAD-dependent succinate-semialdehyde dehydrogenase [unclassified Pseudoclavibacter]|uniref:NAD-dependent succinate-semialdehyde dehydrogenase n=1 Tax=unclassified Pseudoclavibacter TaxID=2615177 RepID=UPI000CE8A821|nr:MULTISPECIES: NAD-dependent succinate-semialdehyde dehydrogenase [unclassified Pseudoclavibacter]MBF4551489.1 NAD-dependent succinate-semialdehyde dehydrogenase [Pseudoclavibacter sp. VKM Ac-2888]PPF37103.1 NADP-dependent succinic semialdehyde dehydrogenase [Pseudoclavibacter sp. AY1H1]PPF78524.1 NADP-dependent succinic semialdehyde dehydrogenase [Pseudoclavibacter sp. Z016]
MPTAINPTTGQNIADYPLHTPEDVDRALTAAVTAQRTWRTTPLEERTQLLTRIAATLRSGVDEYAALITDEMGKPIAEARGEILKSAKTLDYYAEHAASYLAFEEIESNATTSGVEFDPLGVVLAIMPWNYPFWQFFRFAAPALAAGNGAILKHANNVPGSALVIQKIMDEAGTPAGLFSTLIINASEVKGIIEDERIAAVTLTGSTEVGALVAAQAGSVLKKQVLELGGSDPFIVAADADLEAASTVAVSSRFNTTGQSCVNAKRFLVDESIADEFVRLFTEKAAALVVGDPRREETQIGPMARGNLRDALHEQVERTLESGATALIGGAIPDGPGYFYPPTILDHVKPGSAAFDEETFGPVASVTRVANIDEAVELANSSEYGLGATIFSRDVDAARATARRVDSGAVFINGQVASDPRLPFGGIKRSGYGRELSGYGIREFVNVKTIWIGPVSE